MAVDYIADLYQDIHRVNSEIALAERTLAELKVKKALLEADFAKAQVRYAEMALINVVDDHYKKVATGEDVTVKVVKVDPGLHPTFVNGGGTAHHRHQD